MLLSHKRKSFSYGFLKASLWKACEACPEIRFPLEISPSLTVFHRKWEFSRLSGKIQSP